jgi:hypothetical protein
MKGIPAGLVGLAGLLEGEDVTGRRGSATIE